MTGNEFTHDEHEFNGDSDSRADDATAPIGIGAMDENDEFSGMDAFAAAAGEGKRGLNSGAILLAAVVVIAVAGLFSMRTLTRASAANDMAVEHEQSIESFLSMLQSSTSGDEAGPNFKLGAEEAAVLDVLNESYASRQVALTHVQRNPFIIFEESRTGDVPSRPSGPDPIVQKREQRRAQFKQAAGRLELRSVLMGDPPMATINTNIVQVGATFVAEPENVSFRVVSISSQGVVIIAEDEELDLRHETMLSIDRERSRRGIPQRSNQRGPVRPR